MNTYADVETVDQDDDTRICLVGGHRHHGAASICDEHLDEISTLIDGVTRMTRQLGYHLMPGSSPATGEKVTSPNPFSSTPTNLAVLSLVGPGVTEIRRDRRSMAVQVRRWSTVSTYDVRFIRDGEPVTERRELRSFHSELVTDGRPTGTRCRCGEHSEQDNPTGTPPGRAVLRVVDDQVGAVPPTEWLDHWVRTFRRHLGHGAAPTPAGAWIPYPGQDARLKRVAVTEWLRLNTGRPAAMPAVAAFLQVRLAYSVALANGRAQLGRAVLGMSTDGPARQARADAALAGRRPPVLAYDTTTAEWILRYGIAKTAATVEVDASYLKTWLPLVAAGDQGDRLELARFTIELRALHRELEHVLGLTHDDQWVGRCPAQLIDPRTGDSSGRLCGAGIWHDPHRSTEQRRPPIECPRCHTQWPVKEWMALKARIRHDWPIDERIRYTAPQRRYAESVVERIPKCVGCEATMSVRWLLDYRRGDRERLYRPAGYVCPNRCISGGQHSEAAA